MLVQALCTFSGKGPERGVYIKIYNYKLVLSAEVVPKGIAIQKVKPALPWFLLGLQFALHCWSVWTKSARAALQI